MNRARTPVEKYLRDPLEALPLWIVWGLCYVLPVDWASALGGWIGRTLGPRLPFSERARANIRRALPDKSDAEVERIVIGMWDNLGRVVGEFPHMNRLDLDDTTRFDIRGKEFFQLAASSGEPIFFYGAHLGNWELGPMTANHLGAEVASVYREANNPYVEKVYRLSRGRLLESGLIPKGPAGARVLLRCLREGKTIGMLVDQKMNDGIAVPFFGEPAMTAPALADFARRTGYAVVGSRIVRLKGARFIIEALPPVHVEITDDKDADILRFMTRVNEQIEAWIRERPDQWLWLHNRWPSRDDAKS